MNLHQLKSNSFKLKTSQPKIFSFETCRLCFQMRTQSYKINFYSSFKRILCPVVFLIDIQLRQPK